MFRHLNSNHSNGTDDFTLNKKIDQSVRYFQVPAMKNKADVLNTLLDNISDEETKSHKISHTKYRTLYASLSSVAAVGLVLIMLYFTVGFNKITGADNQANVFYLPDNSRVILTPGAEIKYSKIFYTRNVKLRGEAYFEVESGDGFFVKTRDGKVLVLGTRFSVSDASNEFIVSCFEGKVGVDYTTNKIIITEGMQFIGNNKAFKVFENYNVGYPHYAYFNFKGENIKLAHIWPQIENFFGVEVIDETNIQNSFTGSIHTGNVHEVIDIIATSMKLDFEITDSKKIIIKSREL